MNRKTLVSVLVIALLAGFGGWYIGSRSMSMPNAEPGERKVLYWHDPMVVGPKFDKPGKSPFMDMELEPVYADEATSMEGPNIVTVRPEIMNSLGVRTAPVSRGQPATELNLSGYVVTQGGRAVVLAEVAGDSARVTIGTSAIIRTADQPGRQWKAMVEAVERDPDVGGQAMRARLRLIDGGLSANTSVEIVVRLAGVTSKALFVPRDAVIRTGTRTAVVRALGEGRFEPVDVVTGKELGDYVEILRGLKDGERVVVSGQFLIDSEASVRASFNRMQAPVNAPEPAR